MVCNAIAPNTTASGLESFSGKRMPTTRSGPKLLRQRANTVEESIPPADADHHSLAMAAFMNVLGGKLATIRSVSSAVFSSRAVCVRNRPC